MLDRTLRYISQEEVDKVRNTTVAISGLGGVGAITAELLARWGVKRFRLLDMDRYEPSNMNRQLFATSKTLGRNKVEVAAERIREINPEAAIEQQVADRVSNENVDAFLQGAGISIQNADHPSCKLFYLAAREHRVPLVNGYATVTGGRVQGFDFRNSDCSHWLESWWHKLKHGKKAKSLRECSVEEICRFDQANVHATAPSINFVTNMVGCLITAEAIKMITGRGKVVHYPRYISFDVFNPGLKIKNESSVFNGDNWRRLTAVLRSRFGR
jgi:tRNA A37 threonylcarbamoyladenosine dehydratase